MVRTPAVLIGQRGRQWNNDGLASLLQDGFVHEQKIPLCHFDIKILPETDGPSANEFYALTTFETTKQGCKCPSKATHRYKYEKDLKGRGRCKHIAFDLLYSKLINQWLSHICLLLTENEAPRLSGKPDFTCEKRNKNTHSEGRNYYAPVEDRGEEEQAYPTDAKEREKQKKKDNPDWKPKKQKKFVEDHYDDLGDDLSGLGCDLAFHQATTIVEDYYSDNSNEVSSDEEFIDGLTYWMFKGPDGDRLTTYHTMSVCDLSTAIALLSEVGGGYDICEFCGGTGRTTRVAIRRRLRTGRNFDLVTNADLGDPTQQRQALKYLDDNEVLVLVMGPSCRTLGPPSNVNMAINYETWLKHYNEDMPHVRFCGRAALHQLQKLRVFRLEHPFPSWITHGEPWPVVLNDPRVSARIIDQCMLGQVGKDKLPAKKPTMVAASDEELLKPFENLRCDGSHLHSQTWSGGGLSQLQEWTWNFAERIVTGTIALKQKRRKHLKSLEGYPEMAS